MPREVTKNDYSQEEIRNLENGKCWCGKPKAEFDKGMKVYCCKKHYHEWYRRTVPWSIFKNEVLEEMGKKCAECGCTPQSLKKNQKTKYKDWLQIVKNNPEAMMMVQHERVKQLNDLEKRYQQIMDDDYIINMELGRLYSDLPKGIPKAPEEDHWIGDRFEVDHIIAVSLDGEMWDKKNLQILCYNCHKKKTSEDMKKLKAKRRQLKRFDDIE